MAQTVKGRRGGLRHRPGLTHTCVPSGCQMGRDLYVWSKRAAIL